MTDVQELASARRRPSTADWLWKRRFALVYFACAVSFVLQIARFHDAGTGFTPLVVFGDRFAAQRLGAIRDLPLYTYRSSDGYDGQFYAQIAVAGNPLDPELRRALDSPAYRTRRVLLPLFAHGIGLGRPAWVLTVYALSNVASWLILAWALARWWFPPTDFHNLVRWMGMLFGAGLLVSVTRSLTDGPALLLIAAGMRCLEVERPWAGAGLLGAAGLVRELSVLAAAAFLPRPDRRTWWRGLAAAVSCVVPAAVWYAVLCAHYGAISKVGLSELGIPLVACIGECKIILAILRTRGWLAGQDGAFVVVAVLVQVAFILGRPRPHLAWWRTGAAFAVLALFLGRGFWDDPLTAVPRALLPLTLAFNVLVPRTRGGLALLLAGNITVLSASTTLGGALAAEQTTFVDGITCDYTSGWHGAEHFGRRTWRWASGSAVVNFRNPLSQSRRVHVDFVLRATTNRTLAIRAGSVRREIALSARRQIAVDFGPIELPPGDTPLAFDTAAPPWVEPGPGGRRLAFSVESLCVAPAAPSDPPP